MRSALSVRSRLVHGGGLSAWRVLALVMLGVASLGAGAAHAQEPDGGDWERVADLRGMWRFQIGDDEAWAAEKIDEREWEQIFVPAAWEDEGFAGYDGFAWYRKTFELGAEHYGKPLYLHLGRIDDADEVYINGHFAGSQGRMPPEYKGAYHVFRTYRIPSDYLNFGGVNVVAVRVFDREITGGLVEGRIGLYERLDEPALAVDLSGRWVLRAGDDPAWATEAAKLGDWREVSVPSFWDRQGLGDYDGLAWYQKRFYVPADLERREYILLLGLIDDLDETYLNGELVGRTGDLERRRIRGDEWLTLRAYRVPADLLRYGAYNVLAVRVYDGLDRGGIHEGPVGLADPDAVLRWRRRWRPPMK